MKTLPRLTLLVWLLFIAAVTSPCFGAQSLPDGWWLQDSPEKVLAKAQSINQNWAFFHGEKFGSTLSSNPNPFAKTNDNARVEFFQRRNADGFVETKKFQLDGKFQWTDYKLESGNYVFTLEQLIKTEFEVSDRIEKMLATNFNHPYDFKVLKSEMVDANDCFGIARVMTEPFLEAVEQKGGKEIPEKQYIQSETDYYFRKSDGVAFGFTKLTRLGEQMMDEVYNKVEINQPISHQEFFLPKEKIQIAKSNEELQKIVNEARAAMRAKAPKNPTATPTPSPAEMMVERRVSELPWAADLPKALKQAKPENKIVLLDFTGSDWCVWCMKFDNDVLSQPEFASYAKTNLVMVMLDFPNAKPQSDSVKQANKDLQDKFKVGGFPSYVALTSDGKEIGRQVGYLSGGPQAFIAELEKFRNQ